MDTFTNQARAPFDLVRIDSSLTSGLKFECTQCGKCCTAGPSMTFSEAYELRDVFAMRLSVQYSITDARHESAAKEDQLADHDVLISLGLAYKAPSVESPAGYINMSPFAYSYKTGKCPALEQSGTCGIYSRRPTICQSVPFATIASNEGIKKRLKEFGANYGCITQSENAQINVDGLNANRRAMHDESLSSYAFLLTKELGFKPPVGHSSLAPDIISMTFDFADMFNAKLKSAAPDNSYVSGRGPTFAKAQIKILEQSVADAVIRKNKNDLEITRMHRQSIQKLKEYLARAARTNSDVENSI